MRLSRIIARVVSFALAAACAGGPGVGPTEPPTPGTGAPVADAEVTATAGPGAAVTPQPEDPAAPAGAEPAVPPTPEGTAAEAPETVGTRWIPRPGVTWQWQLSGTVDVDVPAEVFDIDGAENGAEVVAALHAQGRKVICYVNAGAAEDFRSDHAAFPASVQGNSDGWPGEHWLDVRALDVLRPLMAARFTECADKGFDAVEADLVENYAEDTGFPISAADQLAYNRMLAGIAHDLGLSIGLKNDLGQIPELVDEFDFAIDEQCFEFEECDALSAFIERGKAVLHVEYDQATSEFCPRARELGFSSLRKRLALDAYREAC